MLLKRMSTESAHERSRIRELTDFVGGTIGTEPNTVLVDLQISIRLFALGGRSRIHVLEVVRRSTCLVSHLASSSLGGLTHL
jgi:hypothetical protein